MLTGFEIELVESGSSTVSAESSSHDDQPERDPNALKNLFGGL